MNKEVTKHLELMITSYRDLTSQLIEILESGDFDKLEGKLNDRQNLISEISTISFDSSDFKQICEKVSLLPLQKKLTLLFNEKKSALKKEISNIEGSKTANKNYKKGFSIDSLYFNKKI